MDNNNDEFADEFLFTSEIDNERAENNFSDVNSTINRCEIAESTKDQCWLEDYSSLIPMNCTAYGGMKVEIPKDEFGFFNLFFTSELTSYIVKQTNKKIIIKHKDKLGKPNLVSVVELKSFFAIYMILGIANCPNFSFCWDKKNKLSYNKLVATTMSLKRFTEINQAITIISKYDFSGSILKRKCKIEIIRRNCSIKFMNQEKISQLTKHGAF